MTMTLEVPNPQPPPDPVDPSPPDEVPPPVDVPDPAPDEQPKPDDFDDRERKVSDQQGEVGQGSEADE